MFLYHCGTSPVLEHIGMGMYGAIVVEPNGGRRPRRERVLVQSEFYGRLRHAADQARATRRCSPTTPSSRPSTVGPSDTATGRCTRRSASSQRLYVVDAGPTLDSDFHVVGEIFDTVQPDGNPLNALFGVSTYGVPAGGGAMFELSFDEPGTYPFVTHAFRWADAGALGLFEVGAGP